MIFSGTHSLALLKAMTLITASIFGAIYAGIEAVGGSGINTVAIGTTLAVSVSFAGLILRQVIKNQSAIWLIVRSKDDEIANLKRESEYLKWEREQARYRARERPDPGPFLPSQQTTQNQTISGNS